MRTGRGWCPFATQVEGVTTFQSGQSTVGFARVGFVDHAAGGFFSTMLDPGFWNRQGVSVHFAIARDGRVAQIVNVFDTAYAQGRLGPSIAWPPYQQMVQETGTSNPNAWAVSLEHEDAVTVNGRTTFLPDWTPAMYEADLRVKRWCIDECAREGIDLMRFGLDSLAGHFMFDGVDRANCPGPGWPRERLYADLTEDDDMTFHRHNFGFLDLTLPLASDAFSLSAFDIPRDAKLVRLQGWTREGQVAIYDGTPDVNNREAGRIYPPNGQVDVIPGIDGSVFVVGDGATMVRIAPLAYWT